MAVKILALAGSLRAASWNRKLVQIAANGARRAGADVTLLDLREFPLPVFDEDLEAREGLPANGARLKDAFRAHQALLIASPEYNSSITAVLKNTIDWVSRPEPNRPPLDCFSGKVAALMSASPGGLGGLRGLVHLRAILGNIGVIVLPDQFAVATAHAAILEDGSLKDAKQQAAVEGLGATLAKITAKVAG